uniref:DNA-directed DNA polymerase n=1 Tax=Meloidogyne enterolobii TaxID=390850 RepID=A0A6V7VP22_MELEN|nr:unnamed protein product [Meloidogyne enterolobii]
MAHSNNNRIQHYCLLTLWWEIRYGDCISNALNRGFTPSMINNGNKLYEMKVQIGKKSTLIFRDSFNLMPMSLASLVPAFGLDVEDKPYFPHLANRPDNYGKEIFPSPSDYLADGMMPEKRRAFDKWYEENNKKSFLLDEELAAYCTNDVEILMAALIAFRREFLEVTKRGAGQRAASAKAHGGIDVLREAMTIASACMRHFRTNHLKEHHLGLVPERDYDNTDNQSKLALKFLNWYATENNVNIQTAYSDGGEKKIGSYRVDGWIEGQHLAIEVNGCAWHGCSRCYPHDNTILPNGKSAGKQRELDKKRMDFIKQQNINIEVYWECDIKNMLSGNKQMKRSFNNYMDGGAIDIRSCFFGGRTGPLKLFYAPSQGEKISYYDVTSLYPYINVTTKYPIGHPKVHIFNNDVRWTKPSDNKFELAILKVFVIPPTTIDIPVLPMKLDDDDRLLFTLCAACARKYPTGEVLNNYSCSHTEQQRGWVSTCTSLELNAALEEGYIVTKLFRVLEFTAFDNKLFQPYISEFMAQKIHSSGFDGSIKGNEEKEEKFIKECKEMFGINIDRSKMVVNKGKRTQAKLMLNNLCMSLDFNLGAKKYFYISGGRFSLRNFGLSQSLVTDDLAETAAIKMIHQSTSPALMSLSLVFFFSDTSKRRTGSKSTTALTLVIVSLWTTSAARIHLLRAMQKVVRTPGCSLLYTDTDSLIFSHPEDVCPLQLGPHLGEFTDEYPAHDIMEFCCGGSKQYGLKLQRKEQPEAEPEYVLKVRGMTLNWDVVENQGLRYQTFKEKVLKFGKTGDFDPIIIKYPNTIRPSIKLGSVFSQPSFKSYKPIVCKGIVNPSTLSVLNFGYINNPTRPRISPPL